MRPARKPTEAPRIDAFGRGDTSDGGVSHRERNAASIDGAAAAGTTIDPDQLALLAPFLADGLGIRVET